MGRILTAVDLTVPLKTSLGGTGISSYTVGDMLYASTTQTLSKVPIGNTVSMALRIATNGLPAWENSFPYLAIFEHQESQGVAGGSFTSGADRTATLNTTVTNLIPGSSLSSNQITLPAGSYRVDIWTTGLLCSLWRAWLYNVTDSAIVLLGSSNLCHNTNGTTNHSRIQGEFTLASSKVLEIRKRCSATRASDGFGIATNFAGNEVYTRAYITWIL